MCFPVQGAVVVASHDWRVGLLQLPPAGAGNGKPRGHHVATCETVMPPCAVTYCPVYT